MSEVRISYEEAAPSPYAGFWRRVGASAIDGLILLPVGLVMMWIFWPPSYVSGSAFRFSPIPYIVVGLVAWGYSAGMESSSHQATLGKKALDIMVTDLDGRPITLQTATIRNWIDWLPSVAILLDIAFGSWRALAGNGFFGPLAWIGVAVSCGMVAFTARKQGWHDMLADCLVVRKGARFEPPPPGSPPPGRAKPKPIPSTGALPAGPPDQERYSSQR